jgi:autotransporter-associated beta strand protein
MIAGSGSALVAEGTSAITIPNNFVNSQANASLNMVGNAAGVTFSGTWGLGANSIKIGSSGASANRVIISGVISGSGGLTKFGSGVLVLSGANTYSGGTTVSSGTLLADNTSGSGTGSGAVTVSSGGTLNVTGAITGTSVGVSSGGTLGGAGTINAPITVSSGGTLTLVDDAIDTLAVNGDMTLSGTTSLEVEETSGDADLIASSGTVTLGGNLTVVQLDPANPFVLGDTFHLIGGSFAGTFNTCTLPALSPGLAWDTSQLGPGGNGSIVVATAPSAAPQSTGITPLSGGNFSLTATGTAGTPWSLHASDDMAAPQPWPVLQTGSITASPFTVNDPTASSHQQRFYRFSTP